MPKGFKRSKYPHLYDTAPLVETLPPEEQKEPTLEEQAVSDDSIALKIEEADDVVPPAKMTLKDRAKAFAAKIVQDADDSEQTTSKPRGRSTRNKFWQQKAALFVSAALALLSWAVPAMNTTFEVNGETRSLAPTKNQADSIITPLLRILDRHSNISGINPDVGDLVDSITALTIYGFELRANILLLQMIKDEEHDKNKTATTSQPNTIARETASSNGYHEGNDQFQAFTW